MEVKLKAKHIIMFSKLVSKMQIKPDTKDKSQQEVGMDMMWNIIEHIELAEEEFWTLIGSLTQKEAASIPEMEIDELKDVLELVVTKVLSYFKKPTA